MSSALIILAARSQTILPLDLTGHLVGAPAQISAQLEALACSDICVPVMAQLDLLLPDGPATASSQAQTIARSVSMVPRVASAGGRAATGPNLSVVAAVIRGNDLMVQLAGGAPPIDDILVEGFDGSPSSHQCRLRIVTGFPSARPREWFLMVGLRY